MLQSISKIRQSRNFAPLFDRLTEMSETKENAENVYF